jgi:secondary thiamine-phosphate synthase enzyme
MKSHTEYLVFETRKRREMVHITDKIEEIVQRSGVRDGLCFVSPMHITAAVYVNDLESGLIEDIGKWLEELAPARPDYKHHQTGEDNGDAHLKSLLLHHETTLPVTNSRLDLGTCPRRAEQYHQRSRGRLQCSQPRRHRPCCHQRRRVLSDVPIAADRRGGSPCGDFDRGGHPNSAACL